jgi:NAD(P)-dependent dehydrogenase (short-subunit alcohol dehydrogenase family)
MDSFSGKTAVVTGGASGMGRAMALRFARAGMNVVIGDVNEDGMAAVVEEAKGLGVDAIGLRTDVSDEAANMALNAAACEAFDRVHVLCLNAGVTGSAGRSWALTKKDWDWSLGILLDGVVHGVRAFVPGMVEHGDGHVVMTASPAMCHRPTAVRTWWPSMVWWPSRRPCITSCAPRDRTSVSPVCARVS